VAGYSGYSKSNNAVAAEEAGLLTATAAAKALRAAGLRGCDSRAVALVLNPAEWHHTSKMYNRTHYYDCRALLAYLAGAAWDADADWAADYDDEAAWQQDCGRLRDELVELLKIMRESAQAPLDEHGRLRFYLPDGALWYTAKPAELTREDYRRFAAGACRRHDESTPPGGGAV